MFQHRIWKTVKVITIYWGERVEKKGVVVRILKQKSIDKYIASIYLVLLNVVNVEVVSNTYGFSKLEVWNKDHRVVGLASDTLLSKYFKNLVNRENRLQ